MPFHIPINKKEKEPIHLIQLTDSHLLANPAQKFAGVYPIECLKSVIEHITKHQDLSNVDAILSTGDIAQEPSVKTYQQYLDIVSEFNKPHFIIRGNHDTGINFPAHENSSENNEPTVILIGQWCLILLNSQLDGATYGFIDEQQLDQLSDLMQKYPSHHILIALHHHTFPVGSAWLDQHILKNSDSFLNKITPHQNVKLVICGHVHQNFKQVHEHITFLATPSTFVQFKPKSQDFKLDDLPPGYRVLKLYDDGQFESEIHHVNECVGTIDHDLREY